jgi:hypothetical protein
LSFMLGVDRPAATADGVSDPRAQRTGQAGIVIALSEPVPTGKPPCRLPVFGRRIAPAHLSKNRQGAKCSTCGLNIEDFFWTPVLPSCISAHARAATTPVLPHRSGNWHPCCSGWATWSPARWSAG